MPEDAIHGIPRSRDWSSKTILNGSYIHPHDRPLHGPDRDPEIREVARWRLLEPVIIWFRSTESLSAREVDQVGSMLSLDERARRDKFMFERDRRDFVAAHALLRCVLSHHGQLPPNSWQFGTGAGGKPYLIGQSELQFNIAHTRGLVACALSRTDPIGIDVEAIDPERDIDSILEENFAPTEVADLAACNAVAHRRARFTELWTLKEAYLKAIGAGLLRPLDEIAFRFAGPSDVHATARGVPLHSNWRFGLFTPRQNYRMAVAVRTNASLRFSAREWPEKRDRAALTPIRSSM